MHIIIFSGMKFAYLWCVCVLHGSGYTVGQDEKRLATVLLEFCRKRVLLREQDADF